METTRANPTLSVVDSLADAFDVSVAELFKID
ncbi:hypothetical protein [Bradyrhizobium xenonodulans]